MAIADIKRWAAQNARAREARMAAMRLRAHTARAGGTPRVFVNSIPKAGTHVVIQALDEIPGMRRAGVHLQKDRVARGAADFGAAEASRDVDWPRVERLLAGQVKRGQYMTAHTWAHPELFELLRELEYAAIFVVRDPRDVVVSQAAYVVRLRRHPHHHRFAHELKTDRERYEAIIRGFAADVNGPGSVPLNDRLTGYAPWLDEPSVLTCRFEDLIGPSGGGSAERQLETLSEIGKHVGNPMERAEAESLADRVFSTKSATFRSGQIGQWSEKFDEGTQRVFDECVDSGLMARYGYSV